MPEPRHIQGPLKRTERRMTVLLVCLLLFLTLSPFVGSYDGPGHLATLQVVMLDTILAGVILAGVYAVTRFRVPRWMIIGLAAPAVVTTFAARLAGNDALAIGLVVLMHLTVIGFFGLAMVVILDHVIKGGRVTLDEINGGVCVYLLLALTFGFVFSLLEYVEPGSFDLQHGMELAAPSEDFEERDPLGHRRSQSSLMYFSIVTLTTLGYGDITPVTPRARVLAALEAFCGQVYLAVFVASLVGIHISSGLRRRGEGDG